MEPHTPLQLQNARTMNHRFGIPNLEFPIAEVIHYHSYCIIVAGIMARKIVAFALLLYLLAIRAAIGPHMAELLHGPELHSTPVRTLS